MTYLSQVLQIYFCEDGLDYCNSVLAGLSQTTVACCSVCNSYARACHGKPSSATLGADPLAGSAEAVLSHPLSSRNGHLRPLKVIRCCVNRHDIYNFLSALTNSNLTSILTVFEISRLVCIYPYPTSLLGGTGKRRLGLGGHALMSGCPETLAIQQ